jgi:hypothetical protein
MDQVDTAKSGISRASALTDSFDGTAQLCSLIAFKKAAS